MKWEVVMSQFEVVQEEIAEGQDVIYYLVKTPFGVANRDFVCIRGKMEDYEGYDKAGFMISTTHDSKPETKKPVRGEIIIGASFFRKNEDGSTYCLNYTQSDAKVRSPPCRFLTRLGKRSKDPREQDTEQGS